MINQRKKGHRFETSIARDIRELGFIYCKTTRNASKVLDDCSIDISVNGASIDSIPFLIQCKAGYERNRPKPEKIFATITKKLKENFPPDHPIHSKPKVLIHKLDNGKGTYMTVDYNENKHLLKHLINVAEDSSRDKERENI